VHYAAIERDAVAEAITRRAITQRARLHAQHEASFINQRHARRQSPPLLLDSTGRTKITHETPTVPNNNETQQTQTHVAASVTGSSAFVAALYRTARASGTAEACRCDCGREIEVTNLACILVDKTINVRVKQASALSSGRNEYRQIN
jgi:hypothetical protein